MKKIFRLYCVAATLAFNMVCYSQQVVSPYEVGTWNGFRLGAVSFTFDDGCANQFAVALPMFNQYGYKMTLFTVINWGPNWSALQAAASQGHEIASHTMSHASLGNAATDQTVELKNSQDAINARMSGQKCLTIAYPNCIVGNTSLCSQYYIAARGCSGVIEPSTPSNFMNISSIVCGSQNSSLQRPQDFKAKADAAAASKGWVVFLLHGIDNDGGYSPVTSANLRGALDSLSSYKEKYWVSPFGTVACYIKERNCISVTETSSQDSTIKLQVTDTLDNQLYNVPVTIRRPLPQNWSSASATQNGVSINDSIVEMNKIKYIMFDAVPDGGEIKLTRNSVTGIKMSPVPVPSTFQLNQNYPNPFNPTTQINYSVPQNGHVSLKVYSLLGQEIATLFEGFRQTGNYEATFDGANNASGIYIYRLNANPFVETKKLILLR